MFLVALLASAHAAGLSWSYVGVVPGATDIAVCPDGTLLALTSSSAGQPLLRSTSNVLTGALTGTTPVLTWGGGVNHISCGGSGGYQAVQFLANHYIGTMLYPTSSGTTYYSYTYAPAADDVKALSLDEIVVHNVDRYDYRGNRSSSGGFTFTYLGDMWAAREIAATQYATSNSGEVAFALNDGWASDYSLWANSPQWSFDLNFDVSWTQLPVNSFNTSVAQYAIDAEAVRTTSTTYLFVIDAAGYLYRATYVP